MKCDFCGKEESLPFVCNYCGGAYCSDHRLPEAHQCRGDLTQRRTVTAPPQTTFSWQTPTQPQSGASRQSRVFSGIEVRDIIVAWFALGVAFSFALSRGLRLPITDLVAVSLTTVGAGFVLHELSHKFVAQRYGYWAEFRMWPMGLVLALITSIIGFIFAAPGATYISGSNITQSENGKISLAGPLTNVLIAALFSPLLFFGSGIWVYVGAIGTPINVFLALFNMLPLGPLDGSKVMRWNFYVWLAVVVPLAVVSYYLFF